MRASLAKIELRRWILICRIGERDTLVLFYSYCYDIHACMQALNQDDCVTEIFFDEYPSKSSFF